jgi:hypothetical protein
MSANIAGNRCNVSELHEYVGVNTTFSSEDQGRSQKMRRANDIFDPAKNQAKYVY